MKKGTATYEPDEFILECVKRYNETGYGFPFTNTDIKYAVNKYYWVKKQRRLFLMLFVISFCFFISIIILTAFGHK